jgi:hypothetical protein
MAITLAREGVDVLLVERERVFRDRVRGEVMATWGTVEAKRLGLGRGQATGRIWTQGTR